MKKNIFYAVISVLLASGFQAQAIEHSVIVYDAVDGLEQYGKVVHLNKHTQKIIASDAGFQSLRGHLDALQIDYEVELPFEQQLNQENSLVSPDYATSTAAVGGWDDPLFTSQSELLLSSNSIYSALLSQKRDPVKPVIVVLDSGYLPHEDISIVSGYSFTTLFGQAPSDQYWARSTNSGITCESAHGNNMAGIISATRGNDKGIIGIADADVYMGRVLSTDCTSNVDLGYFSDIAQGIYWSIGDGDEQTIPKADIINISVAAPGVCPKVLQDAINAANLAGSLVVVSAGNQSSLSSNYAPANCSGVIAVAAHDSTGNIASYSNYGDGVSLMVMGSRLTTGVSGYSRIDGTSGAAAAVTGMLGALKGYFPQATATELKTMLLNTTSPLVSPCPQGCGVGLANLNSAFSYAEKVADPVFNAGHLYSANDCQDEREVEALSSLVNSCNTYKASALVSFAEGDSTVKYAVNVLRRPVGSSGWASATILSQNEVSVNEQSYVIRDVDTDRFEYAAVACDGVSCPFPRVLDLKSIEKPDGCN